LLAEGSFIISAYGVAVKLTRSLDIEWLPKTLELFSLIKDLPSAFT